MRYHLFNVTLVVFFSPYLRTLLPILNMSFYHKDAIHWLNQKMHCMYLCTRLSSLPLLDNIANYIMTFAVIYHTLYKRGRGNASVQGSPHFTCVLVGVSEIWDAFGIGLLLFMLWKFSHHLSNMIHQVEQDLDI